MSIDDQREAGTEIKNYADLIKTWGMPDMRTQKTINGTSYIELPKDYLSPGTSADAGPAQDARNRLLPALQASVMKDPDTGLDMIPFDMYNQEQMAMRPYGRQKSGFSNFLTGIMDNGPLAMGLGVAGAGMFGGLDSLIGAGGGGSAGAEFAHMGGGATNSGSMFGDLFDFASSYNGGNPLSGFSTNPLTNFSAGGLASSITPTSLGGGLAGAATAASGGGGFMDTIKNFLKNPLIDGTNMTGSNVLGGLANYFMRSQQEDQLRSSGERAAQLNDPMQQAARIPFQAQAANMAFNPASYFQTPDVLGQIDLARQKYQADVSKYGQGGTTINDFMRNIMNYSSQGYGKYLDQMLMAGGFNQGPGGGGNAFASLAQPAANAGMGAYEGFGNLLSQPRGSSVSSGSSIPSNFDFSSTYGNVNPLTQTMNFSL